jgi:hypothetical protein
MNGLLVKVYAIDERRQAIGKGEIFMWDAEALEKMNDPLQLVGRLIAGAVVLKLNAPPPPMVKVYAK